MVTNNLVLSEIQNINEATFSKFQYLIDEYSISRSEGWPWSRGKIGDLIEKIAQGKLQKFFKDNTLVNQTFIKDSKLSVSDYVKTIGDIKVTSFTRVALG